MSLTKLAPSGWAYYAQEIATGREDYYAASAERPGRYLGRGAEAIGLVGEEVTAEGLERLIGHGCDPRDGRPFGRPFPPDSDRVVAGFGLTFSPPKTVSVLWGTGGEETASAVLTAHERSVEVALGFLQEHAAFTRTGAGGVFQLDTEGFVAAAFTHRTSRAAEPQLHTHVLVANKVRAADGHWRALDARELYEHQKAAGVLYKAALRAELSASLGVRWTPVDENGIAEINGVPQLLVEAWSSRRHAVESLGGELVASREAELGRELSSSERATAYQLAAYRTRAPKVEAETPTSELVARWREEAASWGQEPERWLADVLGHEPLEATISAAEMVRIAIARLEETHATWGRSDAVEVLSTLEVGRSGEAVRAGIEVLADAVLRAEQVCSLAAPLPAEPPEALRRADGRFAIERHGATRYTTKATLEREGRVLDAVMSGQGAGLGVVPSRVAEAVLSASVLGDDQRRAVRDLLGSGDQISLLVGPAGAGKSRALDAARAAWERGGFEVLGVAPSAMAASVLSEEAGITSETLARLLIDLDNGTRHLHKNSVIVLDEATMARTDDLDALVRHALRANSKIVLAGDPHQLGAVGPGGLFATLVGDFGASELETVRRFAHLWEARASLRLRARDVSVLLEYHERGRIEGGSREAMRPAALFSWREARERGKSVLVLASDNESVDAFTKACRQLRVDSGEVERDGAPIAKGVAGVGDEIVTLRNDRRLVPVPGDFVRNGERWQVIARSPDGGLEVLGPEGRGRVTLPPEYVREHVALSYALTVHKAQGQTVDVSVVLVDEQMTAQQLYVAMSRGREENRALVQRSHAALSEHAIALAREKTTLEILAEVMRRDGAERSAHSVLRENLEKMEDLDLLRHLLAEGRRQIDNDAGPDRTREIAELEGRADVASARGALTATHEALTRAEEQRHATETALAETSTRPARALLPSRLGEDARQESDAATRSAQSALSAARRVEQQALRAAEAAHHRLEAAEEATRQLAALRGEQRRRVEWLRAHPDTQRWVFQLEARIQVTEREVDRAERERQRPAQPPQPEQSPASREPRRAIAKAEHITIHQPPHQRAIRPAPAPALTPERSPDPRRWRSAAELDARERAIEQRLATGLRSLREQPVADDATREQENVTDRAAAQHAREVAVWHRAEAARRRADGEGLVEQATADYFGARDDARIIAAGPGRLRLRATAVAEAAAHLAEIAERSGGRQLPGTGWSDETVRQSAVRAARETVEPDVRAHLTEAQRAERDAAALEEQIGDRERQHDRAVRANIRTATYRDTLVSEADRERATLVEERTARDELTEEMSPEDVATADAARDALLEEQAREMRRAREREQVLHSPEQDVPHVDRGGPMLEL